MTRRATILIVDDEPPVRTVLRKILAGAGYEVREAQDGKEALGQVEHSTIDLVITDLAMPGQEGLETIQILRQNWPELKIIAMTGKSAGSMLHAAEVLGADAALAKPMRIHELLNTIQHLIGT